MSDDYKVSKSSEDRILMTLMLAHRRQRDRRRAEDAPNDAQRVIDHFEHRGQRQRRERVVTSELIEHLLGASKSLGSARAQRELIVRGPPGGVAAARLRVRNQSAARARFQLVVGEPIAGRSTLDVQVGESNGELAAGASQWVRVAASLLGYSPGESSTLPLECRWDIGVDRIWLVITADEDQGAA